MVKNSLSGKRFTIGQQKKLNYRMRIKPKFSIIIPVYNGSGSIKHAIDSILIQSYKAHEIIVVDDGSDDNVESVLLEYNSKIVKYYYQENKGVSSARNKGVDLATGDWICFLDADDWYYKDRLLLHVQLINKYPDLDFMSGNFDYIDVDGNHLGTSMGNTPAGVKLLNDAGPDIDILLKSNDVISFIEHPFGDTRTLSVKKKIIKKIGGFPVEFSICEDVHFLIRLCAYCQTGGIICYPIAAYLVHDHGLIRSDKLRAQRETLAALLSLRQNDIIHNNKNAVKGVKLAIRRARLDLAYTFLKKNMREKAIRAVLPLIIQNPKLQSIKDILSVIRG
ncbi:glycosyltransferase family 2 protein [Desulfobacula sp.]|uniref:glycosyltransferase family 2 protein n=1 Tax=Desulfobacula sp. TaxID=2593537 RepID=UPI0026141C72|nr:glycosyltransferase family 2 protein [Desulfobacula sp.]